MDLSLQVMTGMWLVSHPCHQKLLGCCQWHWGSSFRLEQSHYCFWQWNRRGSLVSPWLDGLRSFLKYQSVVWPQNEQLLGSCFLLWHSLKAQCLSYGDWGQFQDRSLARAGCQDLKHLCGLPFLGSESEWVPAYLVHMTASLRLTGQGQSFQNHLIFWLSWVC